MKPAQPVTRARKVARPYRSSTVAASTPPRMTNKHLAALAAALALLTSGFATASAQAVPQPRELYGVVPWKTPSVKDFNRLKKANVGVYRMTFLWPVVEFKRGARNWYPYD